MVGNRLQRSRGEHQTRALVGLMLVRVPFLVLLGCCCLYLAAAADARVARDHGVRDAETSSIHIAQGPKDSDAATAAISIVVEALSGSSASAMFAASAHAGVGLGVHDSAGRWSGLPFSADDYRSAEPVVSIRSGAAMEALAGVQVAVVPGRRVAGFEAEALPGGIDFVYPLASASTIEGTLTVVGLDDTAAQELSQRLQDLGYQAVWQRNRSFWAEVVTAPTMWLVAVIVGLAGLSATMALVSATRRWRDRLRKESLLGATPWQATLRRLPAVLLGWALAVGVAVAVTVVGGRWLGLTFPAPVAALGAGLVLLDCAVVVSVVAVRCYRMAGVSR